MTLVVSLRVLDGVVLAADSLATMMSSMQVAQAEEVDCPHCHSRVMIDDVYEHAKAFPPCPVCSKQIEVTKLHRPMFQTASSTLSFAQKVLPFLDVFGIAVFGAAAIGKKTIYNHLKGFELKLRHECDNNAAQKERLSRVSEVAKALQQFGIEQFDLAFPTKPPDMPEFVFGLQVVGYDGPDAPVATTIELLFGKQHIVNEHTGLGITFSGDVRFPIMLWNACQSAGVRPMVEDLSLQDAIDYAEFFVGTTSTVQRFANMIPTVGGDVDVALITNYSEFRWIRSKPLARVLEPKYVPHLAP
jgi:hypothetical protein